MTFKEVSPQTLNFNPFTRIGSDWMLITAGQPGDMNTMTASWGGAGVLWTKNVVTAYIRPQRYTKEFVDREDIFTLSFFDEKYRPALKHLVPCPAAAATKSPRQASRPAPSRAAPPSRRQIPCWSAKRCTWTPSSRRISAKTAIPTPGTRKKITTSYISPRF